MRYFHALLLTAFLNDSIAFSAQKHGCQSRSVFCSKPLGKLVFLAKSDEEAFGVSTKVSDPDFWSKQKELLTDLQERSTNSFKREQLSKFAQRRLALIGDTAYFGFFIFCALWFLSENPFVAISYSFGATMGLAYAYGLGKYVETLGGSADDTGTLKGAGVGQARFAFLILLFIIVGKFRDDGLLPIPSIAGFFTYQLASISQGLREIKD